MIYIAATIVLIDKLWRCYNNVKLKNPKENQYIHVLDVLHY